MAANLSAFLAQNVKKVETVKYAASDRMTDDAGLPMEWEIGCITAAENGRIRQSCIRQIPLPGGKRGQTTQHFDANIYQEKIAARCTVFPPLGDASLQDSYGVKSAEELISTMLTPGEFEDYVEKVMEANGFKLEEEMVQEAKN